jgi:glucosamine-6-phosphate deaminase
LKIIRAKDYDDMSRKAANLIASQIILHPKSVLGFATGSTPLGIYRQLIEWYKKGDIDFHEVSSVNLDEYCRLSQENLQSYHYYMWNNFFSYINIRPENVHIPNGLAEDMQAECTQYDKLIMSLGRIDLQLLGLGKTGHIGFNEPDIIFEKMTHKVDLKQQTIQDNSRFFSSVDEVPKSAITVGIKAIMQARKIVLVANGENKSDILYESLFGPVTPQIPASILQLHPHLTVVADEEAMKDILKENLDIHPKKIA